MREATRSVPASNSAIKEATVALISAEALLGLMLVRSSKAASIIL